MSLKLSAVCVGSGMSQEGKAKVSQSLPMLCPGPPDMNYKRADDCYLCWALRYPGEAKVSTKASCC